MWAKYIFAALGALFLGLAFVRMARDEWKLSVAARTWLVIGAVFVVVALFVIPAVA